MKKIILFIFGFALLLFSTFTLYIYKERANFAGLLLSKALNTQARVEKFEISSTGIDIENIAVQNIPGAKVQPAFACPRIHITIDWFNLLKAYLGYIQPAYIKSIDIHSPKLAVELFSINGTDNNWTRMLGSDDNQTASQEQASRSYAINRITLTNLKIQLVNHQLNMLAATTPTKISKIEIKNLDSANGLATKEATRVMLFVILNQLSKQLMLPDIAKGFKKAERILPRPVRPTQVLKTAKNVLNSVKDAALNILPKKEQTGENN